jgi:TolB-like protein
MAASQSPIVKFAVFEVDLESGELRKSGMRQKLARQPFEVLRVLLQRPLEVVTHEELQQRIWPSDTFLDYDLALRKAITRLREVLGDSAESPRFVETIPRRGYRFIAPVESAQRQKLFPVPCAPNDSIAVLPFTSMSPDPSDEVFADGMTEEIINALAQIDQLHVVARNSAFSFKGRYIDVRVVGDQLNVRTLLLGSIRRADQRVRITAQLVNVEDGFHLWSERYDRELKDIFEIQDEIARSIASRLKIALEMKSLEPLAKAGTANLEAYALYVKGRALLYQRSPRFGAALKLFQEAVALDSEYALAWAGIADVYTLLGFYGFMHPDVSRTKLHEAARRAVAADPFLAEAHSALALGSLLYDWDKQQAECEFLRALELNPRCIQARDWYAIFYLQAAVGRSIEGVEHAQLASQADPLSCYCNCVLGLTFTGVNRYAEAVQTALRAIELDSGSFLARWALQTPLYLSGKLEEAVDAGRIALAMSGRLPVSMATLGLTFAGLGRVTEAEAIYTELTARARQEYVPPSTLVAAAAAANRQANAMRHASEALAIRDPFSCLILSSHWPYGARLREDSDIDSLLSDNGLD